MNSFLQSVKTHKQCGNEFSDWHQGITQYGFWAFEIHDPNWLSLITHAQAFLQQYAYPNYLRAPHITVSACGLVDQNHFSKLLLTKQINALKKLEVPPFKIKVGKLNSFTTAMYLEIEDASLSLNKIRSVLNNITADHPTDIYHPHVTLGLYRENFSTREVANSIESFRLTAPQNLPPIEMSEIVYCQYETNILQGPYKVVHRIELNDRELS
jgi:2'-5' RNA ligase